MKILYTNVIKQNEGWGAEYFVNRGFQKLNHETYCIDYRENRSNLAKMFMNAPKSDVFFLQRGDYFPIPIIKAIQLPRFFWASELVSRCRDQDRLLNSGLFNHIFLRTNDCIETVVNNGWADRHCLSILLSGFDESVFAPNSSVNKDIDILFVGTITERRKNFLDKISQNFHIHVEAAFGTKMANLINRSKIILNYHAEDYLDTETRVFEVLGCEGFLLSEKLSPENPFTNNELIEFNSISDCLDKIAFFLKEQQLREMISQNGYLTSTQKHTYTERAREIVSIMNPYIENDNKDNNNLDGLAIYSYYLREQMRKIILANGFITKSRIFKKLTEVKK